MFEDLLDHLRVFDAAVRCIGDAKVAVIGMGQLGTGVSDQLAPDYGNVLIGIDSDPDIIATHKAAGRNVLRADVTDDKCGRGKPLHL